MTQFPFLNLVDDVLIVVLCFWVDTRDLAELDSAFCNTSDRHYFLQLISEDNFIQNVGISYSCPLYCDWLVVRNVKISFLNVKKKEVMYIGDRDYSIMTNNQKIVLETGKLKRLFSYCPNLCKNLSLLHDIKEDFDVILDGDDTLFFWKKQR